MPRKPIDYSKCVIYKLCCKDPTISDIYVGHTTNKNERKRNHRNVCNNENSKNYNLYIYQFIRNNGGFDNWSFIVIEEYPCNNVNEASLRERYFLETLGATLNKKIPSRTFKEYSNEYREQNREIINEKKKEYRERNKGKIYEKFECECGGSYTKDHQARHFKSKKHIEYLERKEE